MKPMSILRKICNWLPPRTWTEVYAAILILLLLFLAVAWLADYTKGPLP